MKHTKRSLLALLLCLTLSGCSAQVPTSDTEPTLTLPPAEQEYAAPIGDAALEYTASATLYLPMYHNTLLGTIQKDVTFSAARPDAESLVRALLSQPETGSLSSLGGGVKLALYGVSPVEQSRNVVTVNLAASALQMDRKALYIACQAITNTLTELNGIDYVNFLVVDRAIGMDVANTLPMGTFSRSIGTDLGTAYDQLLLRRVDVTQTADTKPLSSEVTLYFPHLHSAGILSEVRTCSFSNQLPENMVVTLLQELSAGSRNGLNAPQLPLLADMLLTKPEVVDTEESGQLITLNFAYTLDEMLNAHGVSRAGCMAAICYTLCTYFPGISGIKVTIGEQPVETLMLTEHFESSVTFHHQVLRRSDFAPLLYDECHLTFASNDGDKLVSVVRPVPYYHARHPRTLLQELAKGPKPCDSHQDTKAIMLPDAIDDASIIGLALEGSTLLVNLSAKFREAFTGETEQDERMMAYAIVNTLAQSRRIQLVQLFLAGNPFEGFGNGIFWESSFAPMY